MPSPSVVLTGTLADITNTANPGSVLIELVNFGANVPRISGTSILVQTQIPVVANGSGAFTATVWRNDQITPASTYYVVKYLNSTGGEVASVPYSPFTAGGTFDLSTLTPLVAVPVSPTQLSFSSLAGNIAVAQMNSGTSASSSTFWRGDGTWATVSSPTSFTPITHQFLTGMNGSGIFSSAQPAFTDISGTVAATQLPTPTASTLGGVKSLAAVSHNFLTSIGTDGLPVAAQPAFTDISGSVTAGQLPNPTASTLGGIESFAAVSHQWINAISTLGVPSATQPAFTDISGTVAAGQLPAPTASTLGGIESFVAVTHQWINAISTLGVPSATQPAVADLSDGVTGSGHVVLDNTPTLITPILGVATATSINKVAITAPATSATLTILNGKTLTANNSLILAGTDATTLTFQGTDTYVGRTTTDTLTGKTISTSGTGNHIQIAAADLPTAVGASNTFLGTLNGSTVVFNAITRSVVDATAKGWQFIGTATGATTTVGPVTTASTFQQYMVKYQIKGYNGGTPVGRFLCGTASISTTTLTNSFSISEGVTAPTTGAGGTAIPGLPLAVTLSNTQRSGTILIDGASGAVKVIDVIGNEQTPAVATAPTLFRGASFFSDLGTNLPLQRFQLTVYDTLTAVAVSAQTFNSGTYLTVWGRNND